MQPKLAITLRGYSAPLFARDLVAGITVAMVALPLSLAIAIASGADPAKGLVTAIIAGFLISALGGSRVQIGGPTGAFIVVVFDVIATHGYDGLVLATLMAGVILIVAAYLRIGTLIQHVPEAVISGFTIGIAVIIAASQLKDLFGLDMGAVPADFLEKLPALWDARASWSWQATTIGAATMVGILAFRRAPPLVPGLILAVAAASTAVALLGLPVDSIASRFGALPSHLPMPSLPALPAERFTQLLPSAFVIAFLAGVESLLSAMVADRMIKDEHRPSAELFAQGVANIGSAFFGGLPATGAIARTATNVRAGGRTPVAGIVHAACILAVMMLAAPLAGYLAMPALAGLLLLTAWNMSEPAKWRHHLAMPLADRLLLLVTLVLTVVTDLTMAIAVGVSLGLALRLRRRKIPPAVWTPPDPFPGDDTSPPDRQP